jgi:hypothetical protein
MKWLEIFTPKCLTQTPSGRLSLVLLILQLHPIHSFHHLHNIGQYDIGTIILLLLLLVIILSLLVDVSETLSPFSAASNGVSCGEFASASASTSRQK